MRPSHLIALAVGLLLAWPAGAGAQSLDVPLDPVASLSATPPGFSTNGRAALRAANRTAAVRDAHRQFAGLRPKVMVLGGARWEVDYFAGNHVRVEVDLTPAARVRHTWTGVQALAYFTQGHIAGGVFGSPWVLIPFCLFFLAPFVDLRNPRRRLHLDLVALLALGVPLALLNHAHATSALWSMVALLGYLLVRMLRVGFKPDRRRGPLVPVLPTAVLAVGLVALVAARITINLESPAPVDIGYASVVGADRIEHKQPLYVDNDTHGDTYGAFNYIAYIPFELAFPWKGQWDSLPAARSAAIAFDLLTLLALFLVGRQLRAGPEGRRLGLALAWAFAAFPLTLFNLSRSTNDGLVAMLMAWTLVAVSRPAVRGALLGLAVATKFLPGALLGAFWRGRGERATGQRLVTAAACVGVFALSVVMYLPAGGLRELWNCTLGYQLSRPPDFSLWGVYLGLRPLQVVLEAGALALAVAVGFFPRGERSVRQMAALAAAVTIAFQLVAGHWYFFYVMWFAPLVLVALFAADELEASAPRPVARERELVAA